MSKKQYKSIFKTIEKDFFYERTGYMLITTFFKDFSIADESGAGKIVDTYYSALIKSADDYKYMTELELVLEMKIYEWADHEEFTYVNLYILLLNDLKNYRKHSFTNEQTEYFNDVMNRFGK